MFYEKIMWFKSKYAEKPKIQEFNLNEVIKCQNFINDHRFDVLSYSKNDSYMIGISVSIDKIEEVNINKQIIKASINIKLRVKSLELLELDHKKFNYKYNVESLIKKIEPKFTIINALNEQLKYKNTSIIDYNTGEIDYCYYYNCILFDEVDVHDFPFDWQTFRVLILLDENNYYNCFGLLDDEKYLDDTNLLGNKVFNNNKFIPDWNIFGLNGGTPFSGIKRSCMGIEILGENDSSSCENLKLCINEEINFNKKLFSSTFWLQRKPFFVITSIWMINFIIMLIGVLSFKIPVTDLNDRLTFDATLLLTLIAQKFSYQDSVPKVPYLTLYDKKLLFNFINLLFLMIIHGYHLLEDNVIYQQICYLIPVLIGEIIFFSIGYFKNKVLYL